LKGKEFGDLTIYLDIFSSAVVFIVMIWKKLFYKKYFLLKLVWYLYMFGKNYGWNWDWIKSSLMCLTKNIFLNWGYKIIKKDIY
jgi:hypothetical protein